MEAAVAGPTPLYSPSTRERTFPLPPTAAAFVWRRVLIVSNGCEIDAAARP
jgi:hypothetical protein